MKTKLLFSIFIVVPILLFSQKKKYMYFDQNWQMARSQVNTVYSCDCYVDQEDKFIGTFSCYNDKLDVLVKQYNFKSDVLHGKVVEFYENGAKKLEAEYFEGMPIGEWKEFDEDGVILLHRTFNEKSEIIRDYFQEKTPYDNAKSFTYKKEEPPIYTTACIMVKIDDQKYACSEKAINDYLGNPPVAEKLKSDPNYAGKTFECLLVFTISEKGIVTDAEIIKSTGDDFLDLVAQAHVLNMVPFESAKQYGVPISYNKDAQIIFKF